MLSRRILRFYSDDALVLTTAHKSSIKVKLNKPKSLNALDIPMISLLQKLVGEWNSSDSTRLVIFSADGQKAFCAGGDVKSLYMARQEGNLSVLSKFFFKEYVLDYSIARMRPVQMSIWDGMVLGGGVGISIHSPIRIATEKSMFSMPEALIGLYPDVAGTYFLPRLPGSIGLYLGITAAKLNSEELVRAGVATHFVKGENLAKLKETLVENVGPDYSLQQIEKIVSEFAENVSGPLEEIENIEKYFGKTKNVEEIVERLQNGCEWGQKLWKNMAKLCPLSMKIAFEQVRRGRNLSLSEVLKLEHRLSLNFMKGHEFFEGYRALLLDKDKDPKWQYKTLSEVSNDLVQSYFEVPSDHFVDLDVEAEHRRAPSTMQVTYEDTLESPNNEPASFQLPLKELNFKESNEKDFFTSVRKWVSNNAKEGEEDENLQSKVLICEDIDAFSEAETEDPLDELNEMMKKILDERNGKKIAVDGIRKNIKISLCSLVSKQVEQQGQVKARHSRKSVKFQEF